MDSGFKIWGFFFQNLGPLFFTIFNFFLQKAPVLIFIP